MFENNQKESNECKEINPVGRGGARQGAGRRKGTASKKTREIADTCAETGETPLEYMLRVMRTAQDPKRRDAMAIAAAPFIHPRLAATEHSGKTRDDARREAQSSARRR